MRAVEKRFASLNNLKVLSLNQKFHEVYSLSLPSSLVEFTYAWCDYDVLEQLSACCKCLKTLDVSCSKYIDDHCIALILTFEHLEDANVKHTQINNQGLSQLLEGLARKTEGPLLKRFGCDELTSMQLTFLLEQFKEIVHLDLYMVLPSVVFEDSLKLLPSFKQLKSLCIKKYDIPGPELGMILDIVGSQLTLLEVFGIDLYKLAEKCISFECLHIQSNVHTTVESVEVLKKLPGLKSVKCLKLFVT